MDVIWYFVFVFVIRPCLFLVALRSPVRKELADSLALVY